MDGRTDGRTARKKKKKEKEIPERSAEEEAAAECLTRPTVAQRIVAQGAIQNVILF
jgi:hypothetical protein